MVNDFTEVDFFRRQRAHRRTNHYQYDESLWQHCPVDHGNKHPRRHW